MSIFRLQTKILILILVMAVLSGCQSAQAAQADGPKIVTSEAWGRPSPKMAGAAAIYVVIENQGNQADRLVGAASQAAKAVEVHESFMENNVMMMRPVEGGIEIPAAGKVELKPGGFHIMLIDLVEPLTAGSKIKVTLKFEKSGEIELDVEIREQ